MFFMWNLALKNNIAQVPNTLADMTKSAPMLLKLSNLTCFVKMAIPTAIAYVNATMTEVEAMIIYSRPTKSFGCFVAPLIVNQPILNRRIKLVDYISEIVSLKCSSFLFVHPF